MNVTNARQSFSLIGGLDDTWMCIKICILESAITSIMVWRVHSRKMDVNLHMFRQTIVVSERVVEGQSVNSDTEKSSEKARYVKNSYT